MPRLHITKQCQHPDCDKTFHSDPRRKYCDEHVNWLRSENGKKVIAELNERRKKKTIDRVEKEKNEQSLKIVKSALLNTPKLNMTANTKPPCYVGSYGL